MSGCSLGSSYKLKFLSSLLAGVAARACGVTLPSPLRQDVGSGGARARDAVHGCAARPPATPTPATLDTRHLCTDVLKLQPWLKFHSFIASLFQEKEDVTKKITDGFSLHSAIHVSYKFGFLLNSTVESQPREF